MHTPLNNSPTFLSKFRFRPMLSCNYPHSLKLVSCLNHNRFHKPLFRCCRQHIFSLINSQWRLQALRKTRREFYLWIIKVTSNSILHRKCSKRQWNQRQKSGNFQKKLSIFCNIKCNQWSQQHRASLYLNESQPQRIPKSSYPCYKKRLALFIMII